MSKYYGLVIVNDFSRYTWTLFIVSKDAFNALKKLAKVLQNEKKNSNIFAIKTN